MFMALGSSRFSVTASQSAAHGTATAGGASSITFGPTALAIANSYVGCVVFIAAGTGRGQTRLITAYTAGRVATVSPAWDTEPDNTSVYKVLPIGRVIVESLSAESEAAIIDAVWDSARVDHTDVGTFGEGMSSVQGNVTGSVGSVTGNLGGNVDGNVTGTVASVVGDVGGNVVGDVQGNVDGNVAGSVGSVAANGITAASIAADAITSSELATSACQEIADNVLARGVAGVEATADPASLAALILAAFESAIAGAVWTIYRTDHATVFATRTVTTDDTADPIVEVT